MPAYSIKPHSEVMAVCFCSTDAMKIVLLEIHSVTFGFDYWSDSKTSFNPDNGQFFQY